MREILFMQKGRDSHCSDKEKKGEERKCQEISRILI